MTASHPLYTVPTWTNRRHAPALCRETRTHSACGPTQPREQVAKPGDAQPRRLQSPDASLTLHCLISFSTKFCLFLFSLRGWFNYLFSSVYTLLFILSSNYIFNVRKGQEWRRAPQGLWFSSPTLTNFHEGAHVTNAYGCRGHPGPVNSLTS